LTFFSSVKHPNPAIVAQAAVRRLPRWALLLLCLSYVCAGFFGRDAWRSADITALGFMGSLANGNSSWWAPSLLGWSPDQPAVLPYWLGAWALQLAPAAWPADLVARIPFGFLLGMALLASWYGTYYLARNPAAQPVAFAFGGEAKPTDYARAMADGGVLAFIACLGLAQLSHETTPALAQLGFSALLFYGIAALPYHSIGPHLATFLGVLGLALSGAPTMATLYLLGGLLVHWLDRDNGRTSDAPQSARSKDLFALLVYIVVAGVSAYELGLWRWKVEVPPFTWQTVDGFAQLLIWFTWPAWPLALWTLWRWRWQLWGKRLYRHLAWPLWFAALTVVATPLGSNSDRTLLLALPALSALAAFALPTLKRQVAALIDWFTLLFFSGCGFIIWVVWIAMQTGVPSQPAANVSRLAPGFQASFSLLAFAIAILATLAWAWLVKWRVGRHRAAIWKSLVLPAGGASLCWLLLMTLWMPLLNYAQSYRSLVEQALPLVGTQGCAETGSLQTEHLSAFQWYSNIRIVAANGESQCEWQLSEPGGDLEVRPSVDTTRWTPHTLLRHPVDPKVAVWLLRRR
jgi:hypothetical protein